MFSPVVVGGGRAGIRRAGLLQRRRRRRGVDGAELEGDLFFKCNFRLLF